MLTVEFLLPLGLLVLAFLLKWLIAQPSTRVGFIVAFLEFPVSVIFLALSFDAAFILAYPTRSPRGFLVFVVMLILAVVVIFLWRVSESLLAGHGTRNLQIAGVAFLNYAFSLASLFYAAAMVAAEVSS